MKMRTLFVGLILSGAAIADEPFKNYLSCYDKLSDLKAEFKGSDYVNWSKYKIGGQGLRAAIVGNDLKEKLVTIPGEKDQKKGFYLVHDQGVSFLPGGGGGIQNFEIQMPNHSKNPSLQMDSSDSANIQTKFSGDPLISAKKINLSDSFSSEDVKIIQKDLSQKIRELVGTFKDRHDKDDSLKSNKYLNALEDCKKGLNASDADVISAINQSKDDISNIKTPKRTLMDRIIPRGANQQ